VGEQSVLAQAAPEPDSALARVDRTTSIGGWAAAWLERHTPKMAIDPRLLQSFAVLAEELHFGRAAERLNLAQPALSQQIHRLEQQVGSLLFRRNSRVVELTDAGRAMLEPAVAAVLAMHQAERAARDASRTSPHPVRVGVNFYVDDIVPAVEAYGSAHSEVQLWVSRTYEPQGHEMLGAGLLDAFVGIFASTEGSGQERTRSLEIPLLALVAANHPLAARSAAPLGAYRDSPIAIFARDHAPDQFDYFVDVLSQGEGRRALSIREFRPTGTGSHADIITEVGAGRAVGFGTPATLATRAGHLRRLPFDPPLSVPTYVWWKPRRSPVVDTFVEHLSSLA
jgi:DNA-binding transcriptional LysR family regulator